ncbi:MAG: hypothetical protein AAB403_05710, partial [Planctomycetota bacterium]
EVDEIKVTELRQGGVCITWREFVDLVASNTDDQDLVNRVVAMTPAFTSSWFRGRVSVQDFALLGTVKNLHAFIELLDNVLRGTLMNAIQAHQSQHASGSVTVS